MLEGYGNITSYQLRLGRKIQCKKQGVLGPMAGKYKAWYEKEDDIPQFARDNKLYVNRNGRWEFDHGEFDDLDHLTTPGLKASQLKLLDEKKTANDAAVAEKKRADDAEDALRKAQAPGTKVISEQDSQLFDQYKAIGTPKDLEKMKTEHAELQGQLEIGKKKEELQKICKEAGLNSEAVSDFMLSERGKNAELFTKDVKETVNGKEATVKKAFLKIEKDKGNGRFETQEITLKDHVEKNLPSYMAKAIFTPEDPGETPAPENKKPEKRFPNLSSGKSVEPGAEGQDKAPPEKFNERRNTRALPWQQQNQAAGAK